jgi:hypothetical protein
MDGDIASTEVYQLHIALREIGPAICRRVLVRSDSTIEDLHYTIQLAMGWTDKHLNCFTIHGKDYRDCRLQKMEMGRPMSSRNLRA